MKAIKVTGNNEGLYTDRAYQELRLQLSTGDFHTHKKQEVDVSGDEYHKIIHIDDLVEDACRICERVGCGATVDDEYEFKQCNQCRVKYILHGERYELGRELDKATKRYIDLLTWKQFNAFGHGGYLYQCASKSKRTLTAFKLMQDLQAQYSAYSMAMGEL